MTQDMLRGLNQLINKVAAAVPANMRAPQSTVHDGLTQQAQTKLHQQLSTSTHITHAENLVLAVQGKQLIIRLHEGMSNQAQTSSQQAKVSIPLTDDQIKLVKSLLAQQANARSDSQQTPSLTVSIEALSNPQALAHSSIKIPAQQRTQIALALLVQANQLILSGQIQGTNKPLANLLSLFVAPLDKVVNVPLQRLPNALQTLVNNLNKNTTSTSSEAMLTIDAKPKQHLASAASVVNGAKMVDIQLALNKQIIAGALNTQHVATQTFLKAVNQLHGGKITLPTNELSSIVQRINSQEAKPFMQALSPQKSSLLLTPQLDKLSIAPESLDRPSVISSGVIHSSAQQTASANVLRLASANIATDIALPSALIKPLSQMITQSQSLNQTSRPDSGNMLQPLSRPSLAQAALVQASMTPAPLAGAPLLNTQALSTQSLQGLLPAGQSPTTGAPNSEQLLAEVQELTQTDIASLVLHKMTQRQPQSNSPQSTVLSGLATMVQISLASKLQQQLSGMGSASAKHIALEQHLNTLIAPHIASRNLQQSNSKTQDSNHDPASELLQGITRLLTGHRLQQAVSLEWQTQHPDSQYFTLPNFLSGSKQPIQLLIKQEQQTGSEHQDRVEHQGNKWHISLQFDIPNNSNVPTNNTETSSQGTLLVKATLQAQTVNIALYGSTETLLDNINQHKHALEQRLRQLGFTVDTQPAYQGVINDSLVDWPKSFGLEKEVSV